MHDKLKKDRNFNRPHLAELQFEDVPMILSEALAFSLEKKKRSLSHNSYLNYNGTVPFINTAIDALQLKKLLIVYARRIHIKTIIAKVKAMRKGSKGTYTKHLTCLKAILSELIQWTIIENTLHTLLKICLLQR